MRIARVRTPQGQVAHGVVTDDSVCLVRGSVLDRWERTATRLALEEVTLLAPIVPPNVLCIGRNYEAHAAESGSEVPGEPPLFIKAASCLIGPGAPVVLPKAAPSQVDYEAELVVVIGKAARHVRQADALDYVLGYTCGHDVSARDCQFGDVQWARGKSFETFGPVGPWIQTDLNPGDVQVIGRLNGRIVQQARTSRMIFGVAYLISYLSRCMTLLPGTLLFTGTPEGCGFAASPPVWLKPGDVFEVEIEGIGVLQNPIVSED